MENIPLENITVGAITPNLLFEFEAFIIQFKSCLDIYSQTIGQLYLQSSPPSNLKKLKKTLIANQSKLHSDDFQKLIEKNKEWLSEFQSENKKRSDRDKVVHYTVLNLGTLNVNKMKDKYQIVLDLKNKDIILKEYMERRLDSLRLFLEDSFKFGFINI